MCENERFGTVFRIQPLVSPPEAEYLFHAVGVMHFEKHRPDDIVESGTESSTSNNAGASFRRIKEQLLACAGQFKEEAILRLRINRTNYCRGNALRFVNPALQRRRITRCAKYSDIHGQQRLIQSSRERSLLLNGY